jgi:hypothetical protein
MKIKKGKKHKEGSQETRKEMITIVRKEGSRKMVFEDEK